MLSKDDKTRVNRKSVGVPYKWKCNLKNRKTGEIKEDKINNATNNKNIKKITNIKNDKIKQSLLELNKLLKSR